LGIAIAAFVMSANDHTMRIVTTEPSITQSTQIYRYGRTARAPNRYSLAFSP
jgi:hypothetical protein